jgi:uncharacterized protein YhfF
MAMWPRVNGLRTLELGAPGASRDHLNSLVRSGHKRATAGLLDQDYRAELEEIELVGEHLVLLGNDGEPLATVIVTAVQLTTFGEVTWEFAESEGEGDATLSDWRDGHRAFWAREGIEVGDETPIVCLSFRLADDGPAG